MPRTVIKRRPAITAKRDSSRRILDAAAEEFARFGLRGVRIRAIVERSGVNERMIYHHFGSKERLYRAVLADQWSAPMDLPRVSGPPKQQFVATLRAMIGALLARPHFFSLAMHEALNGWRSLPQVSLAGGPAALRARFEAAQKAGEFRADCRFEPVYLAVIGAVLVNGVVLDRFTDLRGDANRAAQLLDEILTLVLRGAER
jgi:AcrR family transcriptional regulator